jgi:hypothetical protein
LRDDWLDSNIIVTQRVKSAIRLRVPDRDLIPEEVFMRLFKKKFSQVDVPLAVFRRADGSVLKGLLVHAQSWNPPPGCEIERIASIAAF